MSVAAPSGVAAGDLIIARFMVYSFKSTSPTPTFTGWTSLYNDTFNQMMVYYRVYQAGDSSPWTMTLATLDWDNGFICVTSAYRGVSPTSPILGSAATYNNSVATTCVASALTNTMADAWWVAADSCWKSGETSGFTGNISPGTSRLGANNFHSGGTTTAQAAVYDSNGPVATGTLPTITATANSTPGNMGLVTILLNPGTVTQVDTAGSTDSLVREVSPTDNAGSTDSLIQEHQFSDTAGSHDSLGFIPQVDNAGSTDFIDVQLISELFVDSAGSVSFHSLEQDKAPVDTSGSTDALVRERLLADSSGSTDSASWEHVFPDSCGNTDAMQLPVIARVHIRTDRDITILFEDREFDVTTA